MTPPIGASDAERGARRCHVFIHIPKAAGTSFGRFLESHFPPEERTRTYWEEVRKQPIAALQQYGLIVGHFGYELVHYLDDPFTMTVVRDPVERLLSVYHYLRQVTRNTPTATHPDPDVDALMQMWTVATARPLPEFLDSPEPIVRAALIENPQSRQLAQATPYLMTDLSSDDMLRVASARLMRMDVVGCTEHLAATMEITCRRLGWASPTTEYRAMVTASRPTGDELPRSLRRKILGLADADTALFRQARRRMKADCRRLGIPLG